MSEGLPKAVLGRTGLEVTRLGYGAGHRKPMNDQQRTALRQTMRPIHYPFDAPPAAGAVREVVPGVHWLQTPLPFQGLKAITLWLLDGGDGVTIAHLD